MFRPFGLSYKIDKITTTIHTMVIDVQWHKNNTLVILSLFDLIFIDIVTMVNVENPWL